MPGSRRQRLETIAAGPGSNAGLWLDHWLPDSEERGTGKQAHLLELIEKARVPDAYEHWFERWRRLVVDCPPATVTAEVEVEGRMAIGLGAESILETAMTLHRCFGVPCLPGPALKGVAAAAARSDPDEAWHPKEAGTVTPYQILFGDTESSGYVTFHDGAWVPEGKNLPFDLDAMTVHHPAYYQEGTAPPTDWDDPTPIAFLSARGKYLLALSGPKRWAEKALQILISALATDGIGAKTAAGYGRLRLVSSSVSAMGATTHGKHQPPWQTRVPSVGLGSADHVVPRLMEEYTGDDRRALAKALVEKLTGRACRDASNKGKAWASLLLEAAELHKPS